MSDEQRERVGRARERRGDIYSEGKGVEMREKEEGERTTCRISKMGD